jgi:Tol biopolymer transport system component
MRIASVILVLGLLAGACSGSDAEPPGPGRLVVIDETGNVATINPDDGAAIAITEDGGGRVTYFQPNWSPDASHLGVTRSDADGFSIEIIDVATGEQTSTTTTSNSFYSFWSPDGTQLAFLSSVTPQDLGLDVIALADVETPTRLGLGQPLYFSWSPDSEGVVAHRGTERLELLDTEGTAGVGSAFPPPGEFSAPQWTEPGILSIGAGGGRQQLILTEPDGETMTIARLSGGAAFTATHDGERIAILPTGGDDVGSTVAAQQAPLLPAGSLLIVDADDAAFEEVDTGLAISFFWDPTGTRLLILEFTEAGTFRWQVWEDGEVTTFPDFEPSPSLLRDLVPFFDQYAQSMTLWSPDGSSFAFPGAVDGTDGIWVQDLAATDPVRISGGSWVAWSNG